MNEIEDNLIILRGERFLEATNHDCEECVG